MIWWLALGASALFALGACKFDATRNPAYGCEACSAPSRCVDGFCVPAAPAQQPGVMGGDVGDAGAATLDAGPAGCAPNTSVSCYDGPTGSEQYRPCRSGVRTCSADGLYGACRGQVLPALETCNAVDDDCDGRLDEQPELDPPLCTDARACCDGRCIDFASDSQHCGQCGRACTRGTRCCAGACVDPSSDPSHCGACGIRCPGSTSCCDGQCADTQTDRNHCGPFCLNCAAGEACCFGTCADLDSFQHCGSCERVCAQGELCCSGKCSLQACE